VARPESPVYAAADAVPAGFPTLVRAVGETQQTFEARSVQILPQVSAAAGAAPVNILALSGGGAGGAFGAGVLVGWTRAGTRPEFQIVTGVSTGALIAPLAFLGPSWDGQLTEAFSGARTEHLLQRRLMGPFFGSSLYRGEPLAALVDSYVTSDLLKAVAVEGAKGRLLLVATTNLDNEQTTIWNLTVIAAQGGERARELFRDVLIAAASIPGAFPPVIIRVTGSGGTFDELHVDGGTTASLFVAPQIAGFLPAQLPALRGANLYVIVDTQLGAAQRATPIGTWAILKRGVAAGLRSGELADLQIAVAFAERNSMTIKVTDIPGDYPFHGPLDLGPSAMSDLFGYGERCSGEEKVWETPLAVMEEAQRAQVAQSQGSTPCPASTPAPQAPAIETMKAEESMSVASAYRASAPQP
jgi:hypothetical protein